MICIRAEVADEDSISTMFPFASPRNSSSNGGFILPINLGGSINRYLFRNGKRSRQCSQSFSSTDGCSTTSDMEDKGSGQESGMNMYIYRNQLEQDVKILQRRLQEEINLHLTLANAIEHCDIAPSYSPSKLPEKARELLDGVTLLETTVAKLEQELVALKNQLRQERSERHLAESQLRHSPSKASSTLGFSPTSSTEWTISPSRGEEGDHKPQVTKSQRDVIQRLYKDLGVEYLWCYPNELSEEMVSCMRDIFIFLSDSSRSSSSETVASLSSLTSRTLYNTSLDMSGSPVKASPIRSPLVSFSDSSRGHDKLFHIGAYSIAVEVTSLFVGKKELHYAAGALKKFRLLVEQLAKVDPSNLSNNEKLSFWINLYNALILHAYLAYGIPKNDGKYFSLVQKVAYTVGGHSISAAEIEYIILKMKPPVYHPQIALSLALHKFKESGQRELYSIDQPEPLLAFALSYGMHSSPAVRIFRPENVSYMLKESLKDYVQANVGISNKGKILIPKPLHSFAKSIVQETSLPEWICQFLPEEQAEMIRDCSSKQKRRLFGAQSFTVMPFDSSFRYLFLMETVNSSWST